MARNVDINKLLYGDNIYGNSLKKETKRGTVYSSDKDTILRRQKGLCAGEHCKKLHNGKRMPINIRNNFDHIIPLRLRGKDDVSNMQGLCANCHQLKTREDRKLIALAKKKPTRQITSSFGFKEPKINLPKFKELRI